MKLWGIWDTEIKKWIDGDHNAILAFRRRREAAFAIKVWGTFDKGLDEILKIRRLN